MKKQNGAAGDKVRKSGASYENIYHSTNVWLQRGLELICVFLGWGGGWVGCVCVCGGVGGRWGCLLRQDGEYLAAQDFFCATLLIHNLLEAIIRSMKAEEIQGRGSRHGRPRWRGPKCY